MVLRESLEWICIRDSSLWGWNFLAKAIPCLARTRRILINQPHGYQSPKSSDAADRIAPFNRKISKTMYDQESTHHMWRVGKTHVFNRLVSYRQISQNPRMIFETQKHHTVLHASARKADDDHIPPQWPSQPSRASHSNH